MNLHRPEYDFVFAGQRAMRCVVLDCAADLKCYREIVVSPSTLPGFWHFRKTSVAEGVVSTKRPMRVAALSYFLGEWGFPHELSAWESYVHESEALPDLDDLPNKQRKSNCVYFLKAGPFIKIGFTSRCVQSRIEELRTGCPYQIDLIASFPGDITTEWRLHKRFAKLRSHGEWFHECADILNFIEGYRHAA